MKSKFTLIIILCLLIGKIGFSQSLSWNWAKSSVGISKAGYAKLSVTSGGSVYVAGNFTSQTITFGNIVLNNFWGNCTNFCLDIFLAKYDSAGNVLWAQRAGGSGSEGLYDVDADAEGNVYITGSFSSPSITFGNQTIYNSHLNTDDVFIVKYDSSGNVIWAKGTGGNSAAWGESIAIDKVGNVYLTGVFKSNTFTFGNTVLTNNSASYSDIFLTKFDSTGNELWMKNAGGIGNDNPKSIAVDESGNVFMTGFFESPSLTFDTFVLNNSSNMIGGENVFITKYDSSGNVAWAHAAIGIYQDQGTSITVDLNGNVYVTGNFTSPTITFGSTVLTMAGGSDIFIVKYDNLGNFIWADRAGGTIGDYGNGITCDRYNNVYITGGYYSPTINFGNTILTNTGQSDFYVAKYNSSGAALWAESTGGNDNEQGYGVDTYDDGSVYVAGGFLSSVINFGSTQLTNLSSLGFEIFVAKLSQIFVGVSEFSGNDKWKIFPNPTNVSFYIKNISSHEKTTVEIVNVLGEILYSNKYFGRSEYLIDQNLPKGIYFVNVSSGETHTVEKLIIE